VGKRRTCLRQGFVVASVQDAKGLGGESGGVILFDHDQRDSA